MKIEFGYKYRDLITGFDGIVETRGMFFTGCDRVKLVSGLKDEDKQWFDVPSLEFVDEGIYDKLQSEACNRYDDIENAKFSFGDKVKDSVSGFEGVIIGIAISISGDINYGVCPKYDKNSKSNDAVWYDEGRLELIKEKEKEVKNDSKRTGGATCNLKIR